MPCFAAASGGSTPATPGRRWNRSAGWWRRLITIVTPMVRRQLSFVLVAATVANFLLFVPVQVLTRGGPAGSTNLVMYEAYTQAFVFNDPGPAFAQITVLVALVAVIVAVQFRLMSGPRERVRRAS